MFLLASAEASSTKPQLLRIIPAKAMPTNSSGRLGFGYAQDPNDKAHPIVNMPAPLRGEQLRTNKSSREPSAYEVKTPL